VPLRRSTQTLLALLATAAAAGGAGAPEAGAAAAAAAPRIRPEAPGAAPVASPAPLGPERLEADGTRIGVIEIDAQDIFDESKPGEDNALFRLANRLHRTTRPEVVRRLLLVHPGDTFSARRVAESERLLRAQLYFYDARIRPVRRRPDGTVDLRVTTRDVWSLNVGANFRHSGGVNTTHLRVGDTNLLGTGKDVALSWESNVDRTTTQVRYRDHAVLGSRVVTELSYADATDGLERKLLLERPFFSLATPWAAGLRFDDDRRVDSLYDLGHVTAQFRHDSTTAEIYGGRALAVSERATSRLRFGLDYRDDRFLPALPRRGPDLPPGAPEGSPYAPPPAAGLPPDRRLVDPWIQWGWIEDGFVTAHDLDKIQRTEDLNLGGQARIRLGWSLPALGATLRAFLLEAGWSDGRRLGARALLLTQVGVSGRETASGADNVLASLGLRWYFEDFARGRLTLQLHADAGHRLDPELQLLLGGDNGLRGYPLRYQEGDRRFLFSAEQRFYRDREVLHLMRIGAAIFVDAGKAWFAERDRARGTELGLLEDVGFGLRIASSRSAKAAMVHLDVAFPLDGPHDRRGVQWLVTTGETF
jgi:hypothetical protein